MCLNVSCIKYNKEQDSINYNIIKIMNNLL